MNMHEKFRWTDENTARLREMHAQGISMKAIAVEIGAGGKNSVVSKCHRLGLSARRPGNCVPPKSQRAPAQKVKPAKQNLRAGNIARKAANKARERDGLSLAPDLASVGSFDAIATQGRPDVPGVFFLNARDFQCRMPLPGWDDLPVTAKLVCGQPTVGETSWCKHCLPIATTPSSYRDSMLRKAMLGVRL